MYNAAVFFLMHKLVLNTNNGFSEGGLSCGCVSRLLHSHTRDLLDANIFPYRPRLIYSAKCVPDYLVGFSGRERKSIATPHHMGSRRWRCGGVFIAWSFSIVAPFPLSHVHSFAYVHYAHRHPQGSFPKPQRAFSVVLGEGQVVPCRPALWKVHITTVLLLMHALVINTHIGLVKEVYVYPICCTPTLETS